MGIRLATAALLAGSMLAAPTSGQTTAELLQKAIYTQETVGDLDGAIKLYRQIVTAAAESRTLAAQAQFRLATCLKKKGDLAGATKAFEQVIHLYPEQKDLVEQAKAATPGDFPLQPTPWQEGELSELRLKLPGGMTIGSMITSVESNPARPNNSIFHVRLYGPDGPMQWSRTEVERESLRPVTRSYRSPMMGNFTTDYDGRNVRTVFGNKDGTTTNALTLDGPVFDNEEAIFLLRRLPLSVGQKSVLHLVSPAGPDIQITADVQGIEDVQVPAGKFKCYKVELSMVKQVFYIAVDLPRQLVKIDAGTAVFELTSLRRLDTAPVHHRDALTGFSVTAPANWIFQPAPGAAAGSTLLRLLDPLGRMDVLIWAKPETTGAAAIHQALADAMEKSSLESGQRLKQWVLWPPSVEWKQIGGQAAVSARANYVSGQQNMVEYTVWLRTPNSKAQIAMRAAEKDSQEARDRLDEIVNTLKLK